MTIGANTSKAIGVLNNVGVLLCPLPQLLSECPQPSLSSRGLLAGAAPPTNNFHEIGPGDRRCPQKAAMKQGPS